MEITRPSSNSGNHYYGGDMSSKLPKTTADAVEISDAQSMNLSPMKENGDKDKEKKAFSEEYLESQIEAMNKGMEAFNTSLHFKLHKETGVLMIRFLDKETNEVVKEYPPEEFLDRKARIKECIGMILDERA